MVRILRQDSPRARTLLASVVFLCLLVALASSPGPSRGETGARFEGWSLTALEIEGWPDDVPGASRGLALAGRRHLLGTERPAFRSSLLEDDLRRLALHLARHGYPTAHFEPRFEPRREDEELAIAIVVDPGPPILVGKVEILNWPARLGSPDRTLVEFVQQGTVFRDEGLIRAENHLRARLMDGGYETARMSAEVVMQGAEGVDLVFRAEPGAFSRIDSLQVEGCRPDLIPVARRVMDLPLPRDYAESDLRRAALDLRGTQLFAEVDLETENLEPGLLLLRARLLDARMKVWRAAVGTWSDNPWQVRAGWTHRNFFGHGVGLNVSGLVGSYRARAGAEVFWLGWLQPRARSSVGLSLDIQDEDAFHSREQRLDFIQAFGLQGQDVWKAGVSASLIDVDLHHPASDETPESQGTMLEVWSDRKWGRVQDPLAPTGGHYLLLSSTIGLPWGLSETPYLQVQADAVAFLPLGGDFLLAARGRMGASHLLGGAEDLLASRRFYSGGYNTMRGYRRRHLGPRDTEDHPRGGQFTVLAGVEMRFPLFWILDGALFLDSGQVWREAGDVAPGDLSGALGAALDLRTPIGPIRINYAHNIWNQLPDEPDGLFSLGVGYPW